MSFYNGLLHRSFKLFKTRKLMQRFSELSVSWSNAKILILRKSAKIGQKQSQVEESMTTKVTVHVYDMYWTNEWTSNLGLGVYHSGVEVHGSEYAYGGHQFPFSGVFEISPKDTEELGPNFKFKESIELGYTDLTRPEIDNIVEQLGNQYRGDQYHLLKKNCNHFSAAFIEILTGKQLPKWVNRLASIGDTLPFVERALPREWLTPLALQESLDSDNHQTSKNG